MNKVLIDSSFLYALYDPATEQFQDALAFFEAENVVRLVPEVVLSEVAYLLWQRAKPPDIEDFLLNMASSDFQFVSIIPEDFASIRAISAMYRSAKFDFVDCCLMALSERLNITRICTFDRRDFTIYRPKHCNHFDLEP